MTRARLPALLAALVLGAAQPSGAAAQEPPGAGEDREPRPLRLLVEYESAARLDPGYYSFEAAFADALPGFRLAAAEEERGAPALRLRLLAQPARQVTFGGKSYGIFVVELAPGLAILDAEGSAAWARELAPVRGQGADPARAEIDALARAGRALAGFAAENAEAIASALADAGR